MNKINSVIRKICKITALISGGVSLFMVVIITCDVLARNLFGHPIVGVYEITQYVCMPLTVLPALSYAYFEGMLPKFELIKESHHKALRWITLILTAVVEILVFVLMAWGAWQYAINGTINQDATYSGTNMFPIWPFYWLSPIGFTVLAITVVFNHINKIWNLVKGNNGSLAEKVSEENEKQIEAQSENNI